MQAVSFLFHLLPMIRMNFGFTVVSSCPLSSSCRARFCGSCAQAWGEAQVLFMLHSDVQYIFYIYVCIHWQEKRERCQTSSGRTVKQKRKCKLEEPEDRREIKREEKKRKARYKIFLKESIKFTFPRSRGCCGSPSRKWTCAGSPSCHSHFSLSLSHLHARAMNAPQTKQQKSYPQSIYTLASC